MKQNWKPGTLVYPAPAVLVTCGKSGKSNLITVAWTGTICTNPAMLYISVRPERYSYNLIKENMEFTVNLTTRDMVRATDLCGVVSGADKDKWELSGLTPYPGVAVNCPAIEQSPISIECRVKEIVPLGSHHMFIADVVNILADERYFDNDGRFDLERAQLINYSHGAYYGQGLRLGTFGFSVRKKKKRQTKHK